MTLAPAHSSSTVPSPLSSPEAREDLNRYAEAGGFTLRAETHPWYAAFASVSRLDEARAASSILAEVRGHNVPDLQQAAEHLASLPGFAAPTTVRETATLVSLLARLRATLDVLHPDTYLTEAHTLDALLAATATPAWRAERGISQSWWQRTLLGRRARGLAARGARREDLHGALADAVTTRAGWAALAAPGTRPSLPSDVAFLDTAVPAAEAALTGLGQLTELLGRGTPLAELPFAALTDLLDGLASDEGTLYRLPRLRELHDALTAQGLTDLLAQLTEEQADVTTTAAIVAQRTTLDPLPAPDAEAEPEPEPEAEAYAEPEPEPEAEAYAEAEVEPEQQIDAEAATATEPTTDDTVTVDDAEASAAETEAQSIAEPIADATLIAEAVPETDPADEAAAHVAAEATPAAETEPDLTVEPEADAEATQEADATSVAEVEETQPEAITEPEALPEATPAAETEPDLTVEPEADAEAAQEADATPVAEALPGALAEDEAQPEATPAAETEPDLTVEPEADAEATQEADATPVAEALPGALAEDEAQPETAPAAEAVSEAVAEVEPAAQPAPVTETDAEPVAEAQAEAAPVAVATSGARPDVVAGKPVAAYSAEQLEAIVRWIDADGVARSEEDLLRAAMKELGFSRLGPRIKEALGAAVAAARG